MATGGGPDDARPENIRAMVASVKKYRPWRTVRARPKIPVAGINHVTGPIGN